MVQEVFKRKLTAILSADVEGYSRLMGDNEEATIHRLTIYRTAVTNLIQQYRGRVVDAPGDNVLAEFASVVDAVNCAVEIQRELAERNAELPEESKMLFRIGVNLGDVVEEEDRIYGDGVNITARLESLAEAGGICISGIAYDQVETRLDLEYEYLGKQKVKNIAKPVRIYRVLSYPGAAAHRAIRAKRAAGGIIRKAALVLLAVLIIAVGAVVIWNIYLRPSIRPIEVASAEKMAFPLPDKPSIAVLPFDNLSKDSEQEYFSDGITDDLITDLSKISGLFVVARNSTFSFKGEPIKIQKVAEELGVRYVLEGSVRRYGDKIRINVQLIDAITGENIWAERYDRKYKEIFALQDEIIQYIVSALSVKITGGEKGHLLRIPTVNSEAYDFYLRGLQTLHSLSAEGLCKAISMFEKAIDLDQMFAQAYAAQAMANYYIWRFNIRGPCIDKDEQTQAVQLVSMALAINRSLPIAHSVLAGIHLIDQRYDEAIASAAMAVALEPNSAESYVMQSYVFTKAGRHAKAQKAIDMAYRLNPYPPPYYHFYRSEVQFNLRKYTESIESIKLVGSTIPDWQLSYDLVPSYAYLGRMDAARTELEKIIKAKPSIDIVQLEEPSVFLYKLEEDTKHRIEGFRKAGLSQVSDVLERSMEDILVNMQSGEEIKALSVGRTWSGFDPKGKSQWWIHFAEDGKLPTRGAWGTDNGSYWIEENRICWNWQAFNRGQNGCGFVYRNPEGTAEEKNQYEWVVKNHVYPFSIEE